ncbi:PhzF family phenazine biosynthesis protein, partial [Paracoccus sp. (in: a-proteobacteria)]|uniref:PhzF family phenazine biosynthesis protein n=1 Tax=Paracoccus sp. TaxID=267 RepID=UPI003A86ECA8
PTIGCALHLAGGGDGHVVLEEEAGIVPVAIADGLAELVAPKLPVAHPGTADPALLASALDLPDDSIGFDAHRPGIWQGGPAFLFVPVADLQALAAARPAEPFWSQAMQAANVDAAYLYTPEGAGYRARLFSPTAGIPEDPATGSASALLAAQLQASGALSGAETRIALRQGIEMGRPSKITLTIRRAGNDITEIRVAGRAAPVAEGRIRIPPAGG